MLRDLRNSKGRTEISTTSMEILVIGAFQKRFWTLCFHTARHSTWPRYEKQQCQCKWIKIFSYMEITYFNLLCNFWQTYLLIRILPTSTPPKTNTVKHYHSQQKSPLQWSSIWISQIQLTFLDTDEIGLTTDMQTYKSQNLVQPLFYKMLYRTLLTHLFFYIYIVFFCIHCLHLLLFLFSIYALLVFYI